MTPKACLERVLTETFHDAFGRRGKVELDAGLAADELEAFQRELPAPPPAEVVELLRFSAGFALAGGRVDFRGRNRSEFEPALSCGIPIYSDGFGNFWVVHVDPRTGAWAPVLFLCHDPPALVVQSPDLVAFLEGLFDAFRPGRASALDEVYRVAFDVWRHGRGLRRVAEVRASADATVRAFVKDLRDDDRIADLRDKVVGKGFAWGCSGSGGVVRRHPAELLFAVETPRRRGFLSRLFRRN
jgi:hypothetical protein